MGDKMGIVEKVAGAIENAGFDKDEDHGLCFNAGLAAQAAIDALGITILPADAEPMVGDIVKITWANGQCSKYEELLEGFLVKKDSLGFIQAYYISKLLVPVGQYVW